MNAIKFRVISNGKIAGYERLTGTGWEWNWIELNPDKGERWCKGVIEGLEKPEQLIRQQFTGLHDKSGKEIYDGDFLKDDEAHYQVIFCEQTMRWDLKRLEDGSQIGAFGSTCNDFFLSVQEECKVIGDIYSTPELLSKQQRSHSSYITITSKDNPNHPIIKQLTKVGVGCATVIYASHFSDNAGWDMVGCDKHVIGESWLGYNKKNAIERIKKYRIKGDFIYS